MNLLERWPGKSPLPESDIWHPALYHMLDVASVCEILLTPFNLAPETRQALTFLVFLHDIGKVGNEFRRLILENDTRNYHYRHWELSEVWIFDNEDEISAYLGIRSSALRQLASAVSGHHGRPSTRDMLDDYDRMRRRAGEAARGDALTIIRAAMAFWPAASLAGVKSSDAKYLSWWVAGLTTTSDWVGSNVSWFPPTPPSHAPEAYLLLARKRARQAVAEAGLTSIGISKRNLFDFALRPSQEAARDIELPDGPVLAVIEDETGAGKTEAALILAQRMLLAGKARGLFFALPTMATTDAMYDRMETTIGRLFDGTPSLALAHGRAGLSDVFKSVVGRVSEGEDDVTCAPWLSYSGRKALLASVGVGTIDQILQSVLPTKFSTLRMFALSSKLLIVDEVHEMGDPYMGEELEALLEAHAMRGGSAILMTATLPMALRQRLVFAFNRGAGRGDVEPLTSRAYPALTLSNGNSISCFPVDVSMKGDVDVVRIGNVNEAIDCVVRSAQRGACTLWVRNSVDDAIFAVNELRDRGIDAILLHARYALCDRKSVETNVKSIFGKMGSGRTDEAGLGRVLVATQVVESSLDLDFDVLISDLAPVASLIQRAGRLWRHMDLRPVASRPVPAPVLYVLSPEPDAESGDAWLEDVMPSGRWVYSVADQWRTARVIFASGQIKVPRGLRDMIEAVHGDEAEDIPKPLLAAESRKIASDMVGISLARDRTVKLADGYRMAGGGHKDEYYPTRLGAPTQILHLVRRRAEGLQAWSDRPEAQLSELQVSRIKLAAIGFKESDNKDISSYKASWPRWRRESVWVCVVCDDGFLRPGVRYDYLSGLQFEV